MAGYHLTYQRKSPQSRACRQRRKNGNLLSRHQHEPAVWSEIRHTHITDRFKNNCKRHQENPGRRQWAYQPQMPTMICCKRSIWLESIPASAKRNSVIRANSWQLLHSPRCARTGGVRLAVPLVEDVAKAFSTSRHSSRSSCFLPAGSPRPRPCQRCPKLCVGAAGFLLHCANSRRSGSGYFI
jgi:hypothetical protein